MRNAIAILFVCLPALAQSPAGQWISDTQWLDRHNWQRMVLTLNGDKLTGKYGDAEFEGTFRDGSVEGTVKRGEQVTELRGRLEGDRIVGTGKAIDGNDRRNLIWDARRLPARADPHTYTFEPTVFQHYFSEQTEPVLHIAPGDTVKTWSVDAGGWDPKACGALPAAIRSPVRSMWMARCPTTRS